MVTENQPGQEKMQADHLREYLGMKTQRKRRSRKVPDSCDSLCLFFKSSFPFGSVRIDSVLLLEQLTPRSQRQHTHAYTHASPTYTCTMVSEAASAGVCTTGNTQLLGQTRERLGSHTGFSCLHSEETRVAPPPFHWPE